MADMHRAGRYDRMSDDVLEHISASRLRSWYIVGQGGGLIDGDMLPEDLSGFACKSLSQAWTKGGADFTSSNRPAR